LKQLHQDSHVIYLKNIVFENQAMQTNVLKHSAAFDTVARKEKKIYGPSVRTRSGCKITEVCELPTLRPLNFEQNV
jgi:hypothetical protein